MAKVEVRTYKSEKEFEKDAQKRLNSGWRMEGQTATKGHVSIARTLVKSNLALGLGLLTGFSRTRDKVTVTWIRD